MQIQNHSIATASEQQKREISNQPMEETNIKNAALLKSQLNPSKKDLSDPRKNYRVTDRDLEILNFINNFGFVEMPHIDKRFNFKKPRNYQVINRLIKGGLICHERVFHAKHGVYRLSPKGAVMTDLPHISRVNLGTYHHDVVLVHVYLKLQKLYPEATWVSERQLAKDKYFSGVGQMGHLPDGVLVFPDGKQISIEVELTLKGRNRLEKIFNWYSTTFSYKEVWYYCSENIIQPMSSMALKMPFIKIYSLSAENVL